MFFWGNCVIVKNVFVLYPSRIIMDHMPIHCFIIGSCILLGIIFSRGKGAFDGSPSACLNLWEYG